MPDLQDITTSEATIPTLDGAKYVLQLAKHWAHKFEVRITANGTIIPLSDVTIVTLRTTPDAIVARIDTTDSDGLPRIQGVVFDHLARFAHRAPLSAPVWASVVE